MSNGEQVYTEDELATKISEEAARKASETTKELLMRTGDYDEEDFEEDYDEDEDDEPVSRLSKAQKLERLKSKIRDQDEFDLFEDVGEALAKDGIFVTYKIHKGGKYLTTEDHPYSWDQLQQDRGEGHYKVIAKENSTGNYVRTQTRVLAARPADKTVGSGGRKASGQEGLSASDILALMKQNEKEAKEEARREAKEQKEQFLSLLNTLKPDNSSTELLVTMMQNSSKENMTMLTTMMQAMKPTDNTNQIMTMMMEMQKTNMQMFQNMQTQTSQLIDKMDDKMERSLDRLAQSLSQQPEPEFTAFKVMELQESAAAKAEERMKALYDMVEAKSDEKAKFLSNKEPESTTDMLLKNFLPMLGQVALNKTAVPNVQKAPVAQVEHRPSQAMVQSTNAARNSSVKRKDTSAESASNSSVLDQLERIEKNGKPDKIDEKNRDAIIKIILPILAQAIQQGKGLGDVPEVVNYSIKTLHESGIEISSIERDVTPETIDLMVDHYGLPDDFVVLLREYYAQLVKTTRKIGEDS